MLAAMLSLCSAGAVRDYLYRKMDKDGKTPCQEDQCTDVIVRGRP